jgi:hypothetical protein
MLQAAPLVLPPPPPPPPPPLVQVQVWRVVRVWLVLVVLLTGWEEPVQAPKEEAHGTIS